MSSLRSCILRRRLPCMKQVGLGSIQIRSFAMRNKAFISPIPSGYKIDSVTPPKDWKPYDESLEPVDPAQYVRKPPTSAYTIDTQSTPPKLDVLNSVRLISSGGVHHGTYGDLGASVASSIPLEYLALLHPVAEGCAALRSLNCGSSGTLLVYGASRPSALTSVQLGTSMGLSVVAVVDGDHSGSDEMVDTVKGMTSSPGFGVQEEYALVKKNFSDLVSACVNGQDEDVNTFWDAEKFLDDFKVNLMDYSVTYPDTLPAAVKPEELEFRGKDKDREHFKDNWEAYFEQFGMTSPNIDQQQLNLNFPKVQYQIWKDKFNQHTSAQISGDTLEDFNPAMNAKQLLSNPELEGETNKTELTPFQFNIFNPTTMSDDGMNKGGAIVGAIINVTNDLKVACQALDKVKSKREKAEALQFLTMSQRNAYAAASSVADLAKKADKEVFLVGGTLPGFQTVQTTDQDVQTALTAMEIADDGTSKLNLFIQAYRAGDYPVYEDYAIHKAMEPCAGPREIVVTK